MDHFCVLLSLYELDRVRALKSCREKWEENEEEEAAETSQYIQKVFLSFTYKNHQAVLYTLFILPKANFTSIYMNPTAIIVLYAHLDKNSRDFLGVAVCIYE